MDAGGDEVDEVEVDEGDGECAVDDLAVDLRREQPCRGLVGPVEGQRALALAVESGVAPGETVVVEGNDRLRDGAKAEVPDPASRAGAAEGAQKGGKGGRRRKSGE